MQVNEMPPRERPGSGIHTRVPSRTEARVAAPAAAASAPTTLTMHHAGGSSVLPSSSLTQPYGYGQASYHSNESSAPLHGYRNSGGGGITPSAPVYVTQSTRPLSAAGPRYDAITGTAITTTTTTHHTSTYRGGGASGSGRVIISGGGGGPSVSGGSGAWDSEVERMAARALTSTAGGGARSVERGLTEGDEAMTFADFDVLFAPILRHGFSLIKHGRNGPPKTRRFWFSSSYSRLYWDTSKILDVLSTGERHLDIADITGIIDGIGEEASERWMV